RRLDLVNPGNLWCQGALQLVRDLVRIRAQRASPALRQAAASAWARRWWSQLSVSVQQAVASAALGCTYDMQQARLLGTYLQQARDLVRVTALDPSAYEGPMTRDVFSDSDWGGCVETRRSTDCHAVVLGGAIVATSTQTQPGLPGPNPGAGRYRLYLRWGWWTPSTLRVPPPTKTHSETCAGESAHELEARISVQAYAAGNRGYHYGNTVENLPPPLEDLFREEVRAPPLRDLEIDSIEHIDELPRREPGEIYYAPCRRLENGAHIFQNCPELEGFKRGETGVSYPGRAHLLQIDAAPLTVGRAPGPHADPASYADRFAASPAPAPAPCARIAAAQTQVVDSKTTPLPAEFRCRVFTMRSVPAFLAPGTAPVGVERCWLPKSEGAKNDESQTSAQAAHPGLRAHRAPAVLRAAAGHGWERRWWSALSVAVQRALCSAALGEWTMPPLPGQVDAQPLATVLDLAEHPAPSRLPQPSVGRRASGQ
ncbi:unnamed protein product, partial [Symbiodinium natans]